MPDPHPPAAESLRAQWESRYQEGPRPWDTGITPPEVVAFWERQPVPAQGHALDLGCGTGTNAYYLARLGLYVVGVELAGTALLTGQARRRDITPDVRTRLEFVQADVSLLPFSGLGACYILDIGCFHGVHPARRDAYVAGVAANLAVGGYYHLFAFDRVDDPNDADLDRDWRGLLPGEVERRFTPMLRIDTVIEGKPDHKPCRWYLLQRR